MNPTDLHGVWTALITPFTETGIDYDALDNLIEQQIEGGVTGLVILGTTGESPTVTAEEVTALIPHVVSKVAGRCLVMVGSGSNSTAHAIEKTKEAELLGADAVLVVNPYYNKPTQEGLFRHFSAVAAATTLPVVLYNIAGRTGVNLETPTLLRLIEAHENIVGVKEASGNREQIAEVCASTPDDFVVLSGDDGITLEVMKESGVHGVVSVASNMKPAEMSAMVRAALAGEWEQAVATNNELMTLFSLLFVETNPIPVKYLAAQQGWCKLIYRLPLCEPSEAAQLQLNAYLNS